ncbi:MAG TPA: ACT domain-containing protein, partial [Verrucomicrobiae bacterium]|nr:ACT domain-containing protein [Verrucomicrobiae bacterium]
LIVAEKIGKLSIVGVGMKSHTGVAGKLFETLANAGVNIDMISTSEIKISVVIDLARGEQAMRAVHAAFIGN